MPNDTTARWYHSAVWTNGGMVIFGGEDAVSCCEPKNDTWVRNTSGVWSELWTPLVDRPEQRLNHRAVYDSKRDRMIVFGGAIGDGGTTLVNDVWSLALASPDWTELSPPETCPARVNITPPSMIRFTIG